MHQFDLFPAVVHLRCTEPSQNKRRYYHLSVQPTLFGDWVLVKEWGRIGRSGRVRHEHYGSIGDAVKSLLKIEQQKLRRGYQVY